MRSSIKIMDREPVHTYISLEAFNNSNEPKELKLQQTRSMPILKDPSKYFTSIVFFQIQTARSLPVFIPEVELGVDPAKTVYQFTLEYMGHTTTQNITYVPQDVTQVVPELPITYQDISSNYYFVYDMDYWTSLMNDTLSTAMTILGGMVALPTANAPFFKYDQNTSLYTLIGDKTGFNQKDPNYIKIYMNAKLASLLASIPFRVDANGTFFVLKEEHGLNEIAITVPAAYTGLQAFQQMTTAPIFNPVRSLVFTSNMMGTTKELTNPTTLFNTDSNNTLGNSNAGASELSIVTDFHVNVENQNGYINNVVYYPTAEYHLISNERDSVFNTIDLSVYWIDNYSNLHSYYLSPSCGFSIKILYRRTEFNNI